MFISRSRHEEAIKLLQEQIVAIQDGHRREVTALAEQIADLRSLVFSPTKASEIPVVHAEADSILTQNDAPPEDDNTVIEQALRERDRLFSGEYEDDYGT
jgi:hypothetical protein